MFLLAFPLLVPLLRLNVKLTSSNPNPIPLAIFNVYKYIAVAKVECPGREWD